MRRFALSLAAALTATFVAAALPGTASAEMSGPLNAGGWMSWMGIDQLSDTLRQRERQAGASTPAPASRGGGGAASQVPTAAGLASLRYTASRERRRQNLADFVQKSRAADPVGAKQLESLFAASDVIDQMGTAIGPVGLRTDNLADAYTVWWINCWSAVHGDTSTPDRATALAVKNQVSRALIASGKVGTANDALKQQFAEALLVQALLLDAGMQQAAGNPQQLQAVAQAANQGAKGMGLDLTTMRLTAEGFVPAG